MLGKFCMNFSPREAVRSRGNKSWKNFTEQQRKWLRRLPHDVLCYAVFSSVWWAFRITRTKNRTQTIVHKPTLNFSFSIERFRVWGWHYEAKNRGLFCCREHARFRQCRRISFLTLGYEYLSITSKIEEQIVEKPSIKQFLLLFWTFVCLLKWLRSWKRGYVEIACKKTTDACFDDAERKRDGLRQICSWICIKTAVFF